MHIMIIDDEKILSKHIKAKLKKNGYKVTIVDCYTSFLSQNNLEDIDLFLIDMSLGDGNGLDVLKILKKSNITQSIPTIFISGHTEVALKVEGLDEGADDYIMKPFEFDELLARIRSNIRRRYPKIISSTLIHNNVVFDTSSRKIFNKSLEINLSKKEKQVLEYLMLHQGVCISKSDLQKLFWKDSSKFGVPENTINVTICNLRRKIGDDLNLKTIVGEGYCLQ